MFAVNSFTGSTNTATAKPEVVTFDAKVQVQEKLRRLLSMFSKKVPRRAIILPGD